MHLPELSLILGAQRSLRGLGGVRVDREREVAEDDPHLVAVGLADLRQGRVDARAEGALEVGELDNGHRGVLGTLGRAVGGDLGARRIESVGDLDAFLQRVDIGVVGFLAALALEVVLDL